MEYFVNTIDVAQNIKKIYALNFYLFFVNSIVFFKNQYIGLHFY